MQPQKFALFLVCLLTLDCKDSKINNSIVNIDSAMIQDVDKIIDASSFQNADNDIEIVMTKDEQEHYDEVLSPYFSCGDFGNCPVGYTCHNGKLCCPPNLPQECNNQCVPDNCTCIIDDEFTLCIPPQFQYCGKGISCKTQGEECFFADGTYFCLTESQFYCGNGIICQKNNEDCVQHINEYHCVSHNKILCENNLQCFKDIEVCGENHCCPKVQPVECGETCCYQDETCSKECGCLPKDALCCSGKVCVAGETCASDNLPMCYPETGDYCGTGNFCPPGMKCVDNTCCPQSKSQLCDTTCCPDYYDCIPTDVGNKCIPPGTEPCGDTWCETDEYCANSTQSMCLHNFATLCLDGHICEDGMFCAGQTCCSLFNANQNCGGLCCPSNWNCINSGEGCIPPGATYVGNGNYCDAGTFYNSENNNCDPVGWEPCGIGSACPPDKTCSQDNETDTQQCCPADQATLCGNKCCYSGFQCIHDGAKNICLPTGAEYCWGKNNNEWCPSTTFCGVQGKKCIPILADECADGNFCPIGQKCTENIPVCCPWTSPIACGATCCSPLTKCAQLNGEKVCIPTWSEVCHTSLGDTFCPESDTFCEKDGGCIPDALKNQMYDYCGGGKVCDEKQNCGGICSDICCKKEPENDKEQCGVQPCMSSVGTQQITCEETNNGNSIKCCTNKLYGNYQPEVETIKQCAEKFCTNLKCDFGPGKKICCEYDKPMSVGCMKGCITAGRICYDIPTTMNSLQDINESSILPNEVPFEIGGQCFDDFPPLWGFLSGIDVYFHPAGFAANYNQKTGEYCAGTSCPKDETENWISGNTGDEILTVETVWVIDNLEGKDCPHGPYAQFYILIHKNGNQPKNLKKWTSDEITNNTVYGNGKYHLKGPLAGGNSWEFCWCIGIDWLDLCFDVYCTNSIGGFDTEVKEEWVPNLSMKYTQGKAGVYKWEKNEESIYFTIRESDGEPKYGRVDDYAGLAKISKTETKTSCGKLFPLYLYDNTKEDEDSSNDPVDGIAYHYKTNKIAMYLRFRTIVIP